MNKKKLRHSWNVSTMQFSLGQGFDLYFAGATIIDLTVNFQVFFV